MEFLLDWKYLVLFLIIIYVIVQTYIIANYNIYRKRMKKTFKRIKKSADQVHQNVDNLIQGLKP